MLGWELPPYNSGGLGVACYQLAKALADHGADIQFVLPSTAQYDDSDFMSIHSPVSASKRFIPSAFNPYTGDFTAVQELQEEY